VALDEVTLRVVQAGPESGPLVLLLHGFPEGWWCWRHQLGALVDAGLRVWAPDQRGYAGSDKPRGLDAYALDRLADDAASLIAAAGCTSAHIVGHDWGGAVAWRLAERHAGTVRRLAILNCPHPAVMRRALLTNPRQMLRSWYIAFFQLPWLPERVAGWGGARLLRWGLTSSSRPGTFSEAELAVYREGWLRPDALRAMIDWYRALRRSLRAPPEVTIEADTLLIWGCRDRALGRELAAPSVARCLTGRLETLETATHWVQHEEPARVNSLLVDHLTRRVAGGQPGPSEA
jgi:pimeloyl-ACP methyl ester carboxylesterase